MHGRTILEAIIKDLEGIATVEQQPRMEGNNMSIFLGQKSKG
jgi:translation initiation factor IF-3